MRQVGGPHFVFLHSKAHLERFNMTLSEVWASVDLGVLGKSSSCWGTPNFPMSKDRLKGTLNGKIPMVSGEDFPLNQAID